MKDKLSRFFSALKRNITLTACVCLVFLILVIFVAVFSKSNETATHDFRWGDGITEGIPAFSGENETFDIGENGEYAVAYYTNVTGEQASVYIDTLEKELNVEFSKNGYPRVGIHGDKLIAVHYSVTEMTFSVTVTAKSNGEASTENIQSGVHEQ